MHANASTATFVASVSGGNRHRHAVEHGLLGDTRAGIRRRHGSAHHAAFLRTARSSSVVAATTTKAMISSRSAVT